MHLGLASLQGGVATAPRRSARAPNSSAAGAAATHPPASSRRATIVQVASPEVSADAVVATRQTYIQESINFSGAELAARLPSMQAALRAQRGSAAGVAAAAAAAAATSRGGGVGSSSSSSSGGVRTSPRPASVSPAPTAAAAAAAALHGSRSSGSSSSSVITAAAAAASASAAPAQVLPPVAGAEALSPRPPSPSPSASPSPSSTISSYDEASAAAAEAALPSSGNLQGLSASEKLQALVQVQQVSKQALNKAGVGAASPYYASAPKTIDIRMYDQLVTAHNKLSQRLSDSNAHIAVLEGQVNQANEDLIAAFELLKQIAMEFGTTSRLAAGTGAAVQFGVDPQDALDKITKLQERLSTLEQAVLEQREEFGKRVVRKVPVEWIGVASEVKIMGDFDDWTRGQDLSAEDVASDSVYCRFEGTLCLRPGKYRVKFLVDSEWRLAADWPTEKDPEGNEVCLLTVT